MRRLSICLLAAIAGSGCIVNAAPDEGASTAPTAQRATETVPLSPNNPQQSSTSNVTPTAVGEGFQVMDTTGQDPSHDPPPPRPWQPGPNTAAVGGAVHDSDQKPTIGGAKDDDGSKPTK